MLNPSTYPVRLATLQDAGLNKIASLARYLASRPETRSLEFLINFPSAKLSVAQPSADYVARRTRREKKSFVNLAGKVSRPEGAGKAWLGEGRFISRAKFPSSGEGKNPFDETATGRPAGDSPSSFFRLDRLSNGRLALIRRLCSGPRGYPKFVIHEGIEDQTRN